MSIRFAETVRGNQKIFTRVVADGESANDPSAWKVEARTTDGQDMPARMVPIPKEGIEEGLQGVVLVLTVSKADQVAMVTLGDESAVLSVGARWARIQSQLNTARRNKAAMAIRNADEEPLRQGEPFALLMRELINDGDEEILRVDLYLRSADKESLAQDVRLRVLDREGHPINLTDCVSLGDATTENPDYPGLYERTVTLSVRIPTDVKEMELWASSASDEFSDAFVLVDRDWMAGLRRDHFFGVLSADRDPIYDRWFREGHRAKPWQLEQQRRAHFDIEPTFSIVVPLYETPLDFFREMADSVLDQTYGRLQLVLVNASPDNAELSDEVERYRQRDERVTVVRLEENLGIVGNTNAGIEACTGDFVAFFDHDDVLEPDLLYNYVKGINDYPTTDLLYCDEDKLVEDNQKHGEYRYEQAFFKPDWSPDLLRSQNYVCHLLCVRKSLLDEVGPSDARYEGSQDHDLTLRVGERARNVYHARRCLYHWRVHAGSTAAGAGAKSYTTEAGVRAVQAELDRLGINGTVYEDAKIPNTYHVRYTFDPADEPLVSIVIPNKDGVELLGPCVDSILQKSTYSNYEIVIVENNSTEQETFDLYERLQQRDARIRVVTYVPDEPGFSFAKIMNYGFAQARGAYILMLNNDTRVITPEWIENMLGHAMEPGVGCVGAKLLYPDDTIQHAGVLMLQSGPSAASVGLPRDCQDYFGSIQTTHDYMAVTAACLLVSKELCDKMGGLDEQFAVDYNDVDFCLRVHAAGYRNVYEPTCELYHLESVSRGKTKESESALRFRREQGMLQTRWPERYEYSDPYLNPNLWNSNMYRHIRP